MRTLLRWIRARLSPPAQAPELPSAALADVDAYAAQQSQMVPYDETLLERSRIQWQFGDWASLAAIGREQLQHHPDRARLAVLAAAGHMGMGDTALGRQFAQLAIEWGCGRKLVAQVLVSGVYNTLGCAAMANGDPAAALGHFGSAAAIGMPGGDQRLLAQARMDEQARQLGLAPRLETEPAWLAAAHGDEHQA